MNELKTPWSDKIDTSQYPRPQMQRQNWQSLDGEWDLKIVKGNLSTNIADIDFDLKIRVPFSPESILSGVKRVTTPDEVLIYKTNFKRIEEDKIALLHFGAVDYECKVYINGREVGRHIGGYTSFEIDVTDFLQEQNQLIVCAVDPSDTKPISRGKQKIKNGGIWYTPTSGIWQSVWLEYLPKKYIKSLKITPDFDNSRVSIRALTNDGASDFKIIADDGKEYSSVGGEVSIELESPIAWTPENPHLYYFKAIYHDDEVNSYFAMRKFSVGKREDGKPCFMLNNKPYFMTGLLDQGYWSDGLYTAPNDSALIYDIQLAKECGFNTLRKHIKVEPMRWYYHCDRLGMIVWQDFVNGGGKYKKSAILILPNIGIRIKDDNYGFYARSDEEGRRLYYKEMDEVVDQLYNCPSIALWTPFNEGWGQFDSLKTCEYLRSLDNTRLIDHASGWSDQGGEFRSIHKYFVAFKMPKKENRPVILTEFGGYSLSLDGHAFSNKTFGYAKYRDKDKLNGALKKLWLNEIIPAKEQGLCASIYTQLSDVQDETNGLVTYDRQAVKVDQKQMAELNGKLNE
ncbi:MAG: glycoside hydrolase family 2 [Clostridia bacterium]|nr:glycoside hydrolase family 2 [Clostridia bacterium]